MGIARQYWRAWIETAASMDALGTKEGIARQYWRAWIETTYCGWRGLCNPWHRPPVLAGVD